MFCDGENVKEQQRNSQRLQPYSCEYRFGYSLPLGRLQQANYQASVTQREKDRNTDWLKQIIRFSSSSSFSFNSAPGHLFLSLVFYFSLPLLPSIHLDSTKDYTTSAAAERGARKGIKAVAK